MGLITGMMSLIFGGGARSVTDVAEVFVENAENAAVREAAGKAAALGQFAAEFQHERRGLFDRFIDGLNRLPRPMLALGTLALFVAAMFEPVWFASRMEGIALIPEPLWWLMGAIVSFYFGARHQVKGQEFQRSVVQTMAMQRALNADVERGAEARASAPPDAAVAVTGPEASDVDVTGNAALAEWRASHAA